MGRASNILKLAVCGATLACATPALADCKLERLAELPITMSGFRPLTTAKINGQDTTLMVDSGAFFSMLTPSASDRFKLKQRPLPPNFTVYGTTGKADLKLTTADKFTVLGVDLKNVDFLVGDEKMSRTSDGILGANLLQVADTEFDFGHGVMRLMKPVDCKKADLAYWATGMAVASIPIDAIGGTFNKIVGSATVNGVKVRVLFDTGAARSTLTLRAAKRAGVTPNDPGVVSGGMGSGIGSHVVNTWIAPFKSFEMGGEEIKNTKLRIADVDADDADLILGADFFLSHHIYVSAAQRKLYLTYGGGPVFSLDRIPGNQAAAADAAPGPAPESPPTDAEGYKRLGEAQLTRRDFDGAIANLSKAVDLDPQNGRRFYDRAMAERAAGRPALALADFEKAVTLKPDDSAALIARGEARLARRNLPGARADFDAAQKIDPSLGIRAAADYSNAQLFEDAETQLTQLIASKPNSTLLGQAETERCQVRSLTGHDLKDGLDDCNKGLSFAPGSTPVLVSRAYIRLRLGQVDQAISDYNSALRDQPKDAWALYGRGVAETRKGKTADADRDIKAAQALAPNVLKRGQTYGLTP